MDEGPHMSVTVPPFEERVSPLRFEEAARLLLSDPVYGWVSGVGGAGVAMRGNIEAFSKWKLVMRVLHDVSGLKLATEVLGQSLSSPLMIAPIGLQKLLHPEGEAAMARGAAEAGVRAVFSANATTDFAEIGEAAGPAGWWLQTYNWGDRDAILELVASARAAGCTVVVPTVNTPVDAAHTRPGLGFALPAGMGFPNHPTGGRTASTSTHDLGFLTWLIEHAELPVVPKGVLHADDAARVLDAGAAGLIVSNHGGRHGDEGIASLDALVRIRAAVGPDATVLFDGGVSRGHQAAKALALGADIVMLSRAVCWGLAVGGSTGVRRVMEQCAAELKEELQLCGITDLEQVGRHILEPLT
jgi:isopentenyl diphosphate isomerase/L-lactate dehydrogenase-like FMN-dependent dehydrogenase